MPKENRPPMCVQIALENMQRGGQPAVRTFYKECMKQRQRKAVDRWLLSINHPLVRIPKPQQRRFEQLIEELYEQKKEGPIQKTQ